MSKALIVDRQDVAKKTAEVVRNTGYEAICSSFDYPMAPDDQYLNEQPDIILINESLAYAREVIGRIREHEKNSEKHTPIYMINKWRVFPKDGSSDIDGTICRMDLPEELPAILMTRLGDSI